MRILVLIFSFGLFLNSSIALAVPGAITPSLQNDRQQLVDQRSQVKRELKKQKQQLAELQRADSVIRIALREARTEHQLAVYNQEMMAETYAAEKADQNVLAKKEKLNSAEKQQKQHNRDKLALTKKIDDLNINLKLLTNNISAIDRKISQHKKKAAALIAAKKPKPAQKSILLAEADTQETPAQTKNDAQPQTLSSQPTTKTVEKVMWANGSNASTAEAEYTKREWDRLNSLDAKNAPLGRTYVKLLRGDRKRLKYLGENIYTESYRLRAGKYKFTILDHDFYVELNHNGGSRDYRIIADLSNSDQPQFYIFNDRLTD